MWRYVLAQRRDWIGLAATYLAALLVRLPLWDVNFWIDEAAVYHTARTGGAPLGHVFFEESATPAGLNTRWLFWQRPLHSMILWPAAAISPEAFRIWFILLASLLPALTVVLLRTRGVRHAFAYVAGAVVVVAPNFVAFAVYALPDELMLVALVGALIARERHRPGLAGGLLLAAVWIKEFAFVLVIVLLAYRAPTIWKRWRSAARVELDRFDAALLVVGVIGLWPLLYALSLGAQFPGWYRGGTMEQVIDRGFLTAWLAPVALAGIAWVRTREASVVALSYPAFFMTSLAVGRGVAHSYYLASGLFVLIAAALTLDEARSRFRSTGPKRFAVIATSLVLIVPLVALPLVEHDNPAKGWLTSPISQDPEGSLRVTYRALRGQGQDLIEALEFAEQGPWEDLFLVDSAWHDPYLPATRWAHEIRLGFPHYRDSHDDYLQRLVPVMENMTDITVLIKAGNAGNAAILTTYSECIRFQNHGAAVIEGPACPGRGQELEDEYKRIRLGAPPN